MIEASVSAARPLPTASPVTRRTTTVRLRPRFEGSNICTWIGFKHVNYLVEEAVLEHFRRGGWAAGMLYEDYGLCVDIVDINARILSATHIDDDVTAQVVPEEQPVDGEMALSVTLHVDGPTPVKTVAAKVRVALRVDPRGGGAAPVPAPVEPFAVDRIARSALVQVPLAAAPPAKAEDGEALLAELTGHSNAYGWKWRVPYFYCHFTERLQMSGYLRLMEEAVDLFLEDRGISIKRLLDEQDWIPVVPQNSVSMLEEVGMEEELYTVLTVENVFKRLTYTARMDCYVLRDGVPVHTATGRITHGYAKIESRHDWSLAEFDDRMIRGLNGQQG
ncbi:hypothetical protein [Streptomyces sp. NBC_00572]|uniref:hypothetical protein n=1 Tax=Streptomyces sp. NBC_00572 TaxID=2903664 RepID=UPI002B1D0908|nr:hypothetical protein [Streptomyces sp. NBC_00572]